MIGVMPIKNYTVPDLIRNRESRRWPRHLMRLFMLSSLLGCCAAVAVAMGNLQSQFLFLFLIPIGVGVLGAVGLAVFLLIYRPVTLVVLGESFQAGPGKLNYAIADIELIEFVPDPK